MFRFAPSPTEDMHIENLRVALFNYICASQHKEKLIIRIEDAQILEILNIFGIKYDEVFYQSSNIKFHRQIAMKFLIEKKAFSCFCPEDFINEKREKLHTEGKPYRYDGTCELLSDEEVLNNEKPFVLRIKKPKSQVKITDIVKGDMSFEPKDIDNFVLLKADKYPTYNYACAVDDMLQDISFIIAEEDHIQDTSRQEVIREYLGYDKKIKYAHLPTILNSNGKKMNEKEDQSNVKWLLENGFLPEAITNYLILLSNETPEEIFDLQDAVKWFEIENISKSPAKFDIDKLKYINKEHIKKTDPKIIAKYIGYSGSDIGKLAQFYTEEVSAINEIKTKIDAIFGKKEAPENMKENFEKLRAAFKEAPYFKKFNELENYLSQESGLKGESFLKLLRVLLTGSEHGPNLNDMYPYIKNYIQEIINK